MKKITVKSLAFVSLFVAGNLAVGTCFAAEGNITSSVSTSNTVNSTNVVSISTSTDMTIGNQNTGKNSENELTVNSENVIEKTSSQNAFVDNDVDVSAATGNSKISGCGSGDKAITTGDAIAKASVTNIVNSDTTVVNTEVGGKGGGNEGGGTETSSSGGIGGGDLALAQPTASTTEDGIGGGTLPTAGANDYIWSLVLAAITTAAAALRLRKTKLNQVK